MALVAAMVSAAAFLLGPPPPTASRAREALRVHEASGRILAGGRRSCGKPALVLAAAAILGLWLPAANANAGMRAPPDPTFVDPVEVRAHLRV